MNCVVLYPYLFKFLYYQIILQWEMIIDCKNKERKTTNLHKYLQRRNSIARKMLTYSQYVLYNQLLASYRHIF